MERRSRSTSQRHVPQAAQAQVAQFSTLSYSKAEPSGRGMDPTGGNDVLSLAAPHSIKAQSPDLGLTLCGSQLYLIDARHTQAPSAFERLKGAVEAGSGGIQRGSSSTTWVCGLVSALKHVGGMSTSEGLMPATPLPYRGRFM